MKTNWEDIKHKYITTDVSCKELASEFGLKENTVSNRCTQDKWAEEKKKFKEKCTKKIEEKIAELRAEDYKEFMVLASKAENEVVEKALNYIRLFDNNKPEFTSLLQKNQKTIESAVATMERIHYPAHDEKADNNITVVLSDDKMKEYFK